MQHTRAAPTSMNELASVELTVTTAALLKAIGLPPTCPASRSCSLTSTRRSSKRASAFASAAGPSPSPPTASTSAA